MLNVTSDQEFTDIETLHVSVRMEEEMNHLVGSFWETESSSILTEQKIKEFDEEMMQFFEKSVHCKHQDTR